MDYDRYIFQYNSGLYAGRWMGDEVELTYADIIGEHPPDDWIQMEENKVGKIIPVEITIQLKGA